MCDKEGWGGLKGLWDMEEEMCLSVGSYEWQMGAEEKRGEARERKHESML